MTMHTHSKLRTNRVLQALIVWFVSFWSLMAISPRDRSDWLLENLLVFVAVGSLVATYRSVPLSNLSYLLITIFLTLHTVGAHYTYEHAAPGYWLKDLFEWKRNHFDRIVHFCFGLLLTYPFRESLVRLAKLSGFWSYFFPFTFVLAASSFFELLESWVAMIVSPELGQLIWAHRETEWDAHQDMTAAMIGSAICLGLVALHARNRQRQEQAHASSEKLATR